MMEMAGLLMILLLLLRLLLLLLLLFSTAIMNMGILFRRLRTAGIHDNRWLLVLSILLVSLQLY